MLSLDQPLLRHLALRVARARRGMTLGVRGIAIEDDRVCLVRHTYVGGWHLPGGGVEPGETAAAAMIREFREEAEIAVDPMTPLHLHGFFLNRVGGGRDHVAVYRAPAFAAAGVKAPDREIAECRFFPLDALPPHTTPGTRARLAEIRSGAPPATAW